MLRNTSDNSNEQARKRALIFALVVSIATFVFVGYILCRYHPTGISTDEDNNINLNTFIGYNAPIPVDSIEIVATYPQVGSNKGGLMQHLVRTNGASYGRVKYGRFKNTKTGTKMFLYLTGQPDTVCFKYNGLLYVTDDWRTK